MLPADRVWDAVRARQSDIRELYSAFFRRDTDVFLDVSEGGHFHQKLGLSVALAVFAGVCVVIAGWWGALIRPAFVEVGRWGITAVVVTVVAAGVTWLILRAVSKRKSFFLFLNLALITLSLLGTLPTVVLSLGVLASPMFRQDVERFEAGRGKGTKLFEVYCAQVEDRARLFEHGNRLLANTSEQQDIARRLAIANGWVSQSRLRLTRLGKQYEADPEDHQLLRRLEDEVDYYESAVQNYAATTEFQIAAMREGIDLIYAGLDLQMEATLRPFSVLPAYPLIATSLIIGVIAGLLIWILAVIHAWKASVVLSNPRWRQWGARVLTVLAALGLWFTIGAAQSGVLEGMMTPLPSRAAELESIKYTYEKAALRCGQLDRHALW